MKRNRPLVSGLMVLTMMAIAACGDRAPTTAPDPNAQTTPPGEVTPGTDTGNAEEPSAGQTADAMDRTIVPGERIGPVTSETSRDELAAIYGEDALKDQPIPMGEGTTEPGTVVDLGPDDHFAIVWTDASQTEPLLAKEFGTAWKTPEGLGVGVPYSTLKSALGSFQLYGFAWDYEGSLVLEGSKLDQYYGDLLLRVQPSETAMKEHTDAYQAVMGDTLYASDDPNLEPLDLSVYEMTIYLNPLTEE